MTILAAGTSTPAFSLHSTPDQGVALKDFRGRNVTNHNPRFLPVLHPPLETGVETLVVAARAWLANGAGA